MPVTVRTIQTVVPPVVLAQPQVRDVYGSQPGLDRLASRLLPASFNAAGISTRHSVVDDFDLAKDADSPTFFDKATGKLLVPSTRVRNELYVEKARPLYVEAARKALEACDEIAPGDVTHVVTVSCTGFYAPGPEYDIVRGLKLAPTTHRYHIGFMGCYAAFPALRAAKSFCDADPDAVVLIVCVELCTLHVRSSNDPDQIMASSIFADGAASAIVTGRDRRPNTENGLAPATLRIDRLETVLAPEGENDMTWTIGDEGFEMVLSSYVPKIVDKHIEGALAPLLAHDPALVADPASAITHWAIHPGGRSILDKVEAKLGLSEVQVAPSRQVLNDHGNMSSATILYVLKKIMEAATPGENTRLCAMAFGPGITVESALFTLSPVPVAHVHEGLAASRQRSARGDAMDVHEPKSLPNSPGPLAHEATQPTASDMPGILERAEASWVNLDDPADNTLTEECDREPETAGAPA